MDDNLGPNEVETQPDIPCPSCGHRERPDRRFCTECGERATRRARDAGCPDPARLPARLCSTTGIVDPDARTVERYALAEAAFRLVGTDRGAVTFRAAPFPDLEIDLGRVWL